MISALLNILICFLKFKLLKVIILKPFDFRKRLISLLLINLQCFSFESDLSIKTFLKLLVDLLYFRNFFLDDQLSMLAYSFAHKRMCL